MERVCGVLGVEHLDCAAQAHHASLAIVILASVVVGVLTVVLFARNNSYSSETPTNTLPRVPGVPILGNALDLASGEDLVEILEKWADKYGAETGAFELNAAGKRLVVVCREDTLLDVMKHRPFEVVRGDMMKEVVSMIAAGVFTADGETWRTERRAIGHAFGFGRLDAFVQGLQTTSSRLVDVWKHQCKQLIQEGKPPIFEVTEDLHRYTLDSVAYVALRLDLNSISKSESSTEIVRDIRSCFTILQKRFDSLIPYYRLPFGLGAVLDGGRGPAKRLNKLVADIVTELQHQYQTQSEFAADSSILASLVRDNAEARALGESTPLSREQLIGNIIGVFVAGTDTTASTLCWMLYYLSQDSNLQTAAAAEADAYVKSTENADRPMSCSEIMKRLVTIRCIFFEALRIHGPGGLLLLSNKGAPNLRIAGVPIEPRSCEIIAMISRASRCTLVPPSDQDNDGALAADKFAPRRWLDPSGCDVISGGAVPRSFMTFGYGARICPGKDLAQLEAIICVAKLLHNFRLSLEPGHPPVKPVFNFALQPDRPIRLRFESRSPPNSDLS